MEFLQIVSHKKSIKQFQKQFDNIIKYQKYLPKKPQMISKLKAKISYKNCYQSKFNNNIGKNKETFRRKWS
jgi:hypothetical protein